MALDFREWGAVKDFIYRETQKHFNKKEVHTKDRIRIVPDLEKYRLEDPFFMAQFKGRIPQNYSVYFDDEFVCRFDSSYPPEAIMTVFWRGLAPLYEQRKIYFNKDFYKAEEDIKKHEKNRKKQAQLDNIKKMSASPEVKEIIANLVKDEPKGGKRATSA